jgi:hypothetical protein
MEETMTPEQVQRNISAAFDSVNLINNEITQEATDNRKDSVTRNYQHLEIMLAKTWFVEGLTEQQRADIDAAIAAGQTFAA